MSRGKRSPAARSLAHFRAALLVLCACALLLAAAWASWRWQHSSSASCGAEPRADTTPAADQAHQRWERCRALRQADRAVPAAMAVFAVTVTGSGLVFARFTRAGPRWARGEVR
jgi:hypothetical protein